MTKYHFDDDIEPWYSFDEIQPLSGQLCLIKTTEISEAYYTPKKEFRVTEVLDKGTVTSWRPVYGSDKDM